MPRLLQNPSRKAKNERQPMPSARKRVLVFGTFDGFHPGHKFFLESAKTYGEKLVVVIARDQTVRQVKGHRPVRNEEERLQTLREAGYDAVLGSIGDKYAVLTEHRPETICLGYDQQSFTDGLAEACKKIGLKAEILRLPAYHPEKFKSSLLDRV